MLKSITNIKGKNLAILIMGTMVLSCATNNSQDSKVTQVTPVDVDEAPPVYDKPKYAEGEPQNLAKSATSSRMNIAKNTLDVEPVYFGFDSTLINAYATKRLEDLATDLKVYENIDKVIVQGHTDEVGPAEYNLNLGLRRAVAVRDYLVFHGVNPDRLEAVTMGESSPVIDEGEDARIRKNRRVEIIIPRMTTPTLTSTD
jgi:outer membrane protein OmpA-like peptidoglycan-associated protein